MLDAGTADAFDAPDLARRMMSLAAALLGTMTVAQCQQAQLPMDHASRLDWDFIPKSDRVGLPLGAMTPHQRTLAHTLLATGLGARTYTQALAIMAMENILRERIAPVAGVNAGDVRDADRYFFAFYGEPAFERTWAWRVLGHHLSVSWTVIEQQRVAMTPCNLGSEPARSGVLDPLGEEERTAFELLHALEPDQAATAVIHDRAPADYVTRQVPLIGAVEYPDFYDLGIPHYRISEDDRAALAFRADQPAGVQASTLRSEQADRLWRLVTLHLERAPAELAARQLDRVEREGAENLWFAWAGGREPGTSHYFRVQGSHLLLEFDNAIDSGDHIHSVWRDYRNDLGHDLLLDHYARAARTGSHLSTRLRSSVPRPDDDGRNPVPGANE